MVEDNNNNKKSPLMLSVGDTKAIAPEDKVQITDTDLSSSSLSGGNLDKIRDILFGSQMRTYEKRLARVEERLLKETSDLKDEMRRRFDQLELSLKRESDTLSDRLKVEARERGEAVGDLSRELKDSTRTLDRKLVQLDDQTTKAQRDTNLQILEKSKSLNDDLQRKYDALLALVEREVQELRYDKTDRAALAAVFTEAAMRLNNEFKLPGND